MLTSYVSGCMHGLSTTIGCLRSVDIAICSCYVAAMKLAIYFLTTMEYNKVQLLFLQFNMRLSQEH